MEKFIQEVHPRWNHKVPNMEVLILGNFPPPPNKDGLRKSRHYEFFYPNRYNRFWSTLAAVADRPLKYGEGPRAVQERRLLMDHLRVGVQNIGQIIYRKGRSTKDTDIEIHKYQDILKTLQQNPSVHTLLIAGFSAKHSTYHSFIRYLKEKKLSLPELGKPHAKMEFTLILPEGRRVRCVVSASTSRAARQVTAKYLEERFRYALIRP